MEGIDHIALSVSDIERSLEFYCGLLGFKLLRRLDCGADSKLGEVVGLPRCQAEVAHLYMNGSMLELFQYADPRGRAFARERNQADIGWSHMGLTTSDARADYQRLRSEGVGFLSEPVEFRPDVWIVYMVGPDGEVLELRECPDGDEAGAR